MKNLTTLTLCAMLVACTDIRTVTEEVEVPIECATDCDDGNPCTEDVCDSAGECQHFAIPFCLGCSSHEDCDDGDDCTLDVCAYNGHCVYDLVCVEDLDLDGDGFSYPYDCDDLRTDVYPDAPELCDFRDNNCNSLIDEEDTCEYNCPTSSIIYPEDCGVTTPLPEDKVSLQIANLGCSGAGGPLFLAPGDVYQLGFYPSNLEAGDFIEELVITQYLGDSPLSTTETVYAELHLIGFDPTSEADGPFNYRVSPSVVRLDDDGVFRFTNVQLPDLENLHFHQLVVRIQIPRDYAGPVQFGLDRPEDFRVTGKTHVVHHCDIASLGPHGIVLCPDRDGDGFDSSICGGLDCRDIDPLVNPRHTEIPDDGLDNDCNGFTDDVDTPECLACGGCSLTVTSLESAPIGFSDGEELTMLWFKIKAHRDVEIREIALSMGADCNMDDSLWYEPHDGFFVETGSPCGSPSEPYEGFVNDATGEFLVSDIKITRADVGWTMAGPVVLSSFDSHSDGWANGLHLTDSFYMRAGETIELTLKADVSSASMLQAVILAQEIVLRDMPSCINSDPIIVGMPRTPTP